MNHMRKLLERGIQDGAKLREKHKKAAILIDSIDYELQGIRLIHSDFMVPRKGNDPLPSL